MRPVKPTQFAAGGAALAVAAGIAWRIVAGGAAAEEEAPPPAALVTLAQVKSDTVRETVEAYGTVTGSTASSRTLAVPRAVIVDRLLVTAGTPVTAGAPLIVVANAPASAQAYRQAADAAAFAEKDLARVQRLYDQHLAANDQLIAAQKALADARAGLGAQRASGAGAGRQTLTAPFAGVVATAPVAAGDHVAADAALMSLVATNGLVAQLGVEPQKAASLATGQSVSLAPLFHPERRIDTRLSVVSRQLDAASHMINVTAPLKGAPLALGESLKAEVTVSTHPGLTVPRAAVVFDEDGAHVFVVAGGKAKLVAVKTGAGQGEDIEVRGPLRAGDAVAVQGAYQLQDGMAVRVAK